MDTTPGRRERKKAATRRNVADTARRLFLDRGYDDVGIREIAANADVAVTTVFAHFPCKEALVFSDDAAFESQLRRAASERPADTPLISALHAELRAMLEHCASPEAAPMWRMIDASPDLRTYEAAMRARHAVSLADAIAASEGLPHTTTACRTVARFVLDSFDLARSSDDPIGTAEQVFTMIDAAWHARP